MHRVVEAIAAAFCLKEVLYQQMVKRLQLPADVDQVITVI